MVAYDASPWFAMTTEGSTLLYCKFFLMDSTAWGSKSLAIIFEIPGISLM